MNHSPHSECLEESSRDDSVDSASNTTTREVAHTSAVCPCCGTKHPTSSIKETTLESEHSQSLRPEEDILHHLLSGSNMGDMTSGEQELLQHLLSGSNVSDAL